MYLENWDSLIKICLAENTIYCFIFKSLNMFLTSEITTSGEGERVRHNDPEIVCFQILQKASFNFGVALLDFHILEGVVIVA